jgi:stage II sporulation protein D
MKYMKRLTLFFMLLTTTLTEIEAEERVKVRIFSDHFSQSVIFSVISGEYEIIGINGEPVGLTEGEPLYISKYREKLVVKSIKSKGFVCDSVVCRGLTGNDSFSLMINAGTGSRRYYSDDLHCHPDMGTLLLINSCDADNYLAGVVEAEGGSGKEREYYKTQAVIARTYLYKYFDKHIADGYNVCDNTHCQVFKGLSPDSLINRAVLETKDTVILDRDSTLIISAFHSNCGGETASSGDVWLTNEPYLRRVNDPYCVSGKNAKWELHLTLGDWIALITKSGYSDDSREPGDLDFIQSSRLIHYITGSTMISLRTIRTELNLRSTFFSVYSEGDSIILKGRGYGHGVGLCQEGAMQMAKEGFDYKEIINFYYYDVLVTGLKNAVFLSAGS